MTDAIDFQRSVARFSATGVGYIVDVLRGVYQILNSTEGLNDAGDSDAKLFLGDFIDALDECDSIEIVEDEEFLLDEL